MSYLQIEQNSPEWWDYKVFKVSGTRFGQVISSRENSLVEELADEYLNGQCEISDFEDEDVLFGIENESIALSLYEEMTGLKLIRGGVLQSDTNPNHMASPDAITDDKKIVVEVKCTRHGKAHLKRFLKGIDSQYKPQIINYFAVDPIVEEVHFISYCPFRKEKPIIAIILKRDTVIYSKPKETIQDVCYRAEIALKEVFEQANELINNFTKIEF